MKTLAIAKCLETLTLKEDIEECTDSGVRLVVRSHGP
jgi:hypothetical protein